LSFIAAAAAADVAAVTATMVTVAIDFHLQQQLVLSKSVGQITE